MSRISTVCLPSFHLKLAFWILLFSAISLVQAQAAQVTISWTANTEIDLVGYKVYSGATSHTYDLPVVLVPVGQTSISLPMPEDGRTYFFAMTAYDTANQESPLSTEVLWTSPEPNSPPVANASSLLATEDVVAYGTLSASDPDGDSLSYAIVSNGSKGAVTVTDAATGAYSYAPNANETGSDSFTFKVNDGELDSNVATVTVSITAVNKAPVASNASLTVKKNSKANNSVLTAKDPDGDAITYSIVAKPTKGTVTLSNAATGAYSYKPNARATGTDSFTFKANDGKLDSNVAMVSITISTTRPGKSSSMGIAVSAGETEEQRALAADTSVDGYLFLHEPKGVVWADYRLSMTVPSMDDDVVDILFRYEDSKNYYRFTWDAQLSTRQLVKCENGEITVLAEDAERNIPGKMYLVEVVVDDETLEVRIDDQVVFSVTDGSFASGLVALGSLNNSEGFFENILVEDLNTGKILFQ